MKKPWASAAAILALALFAPVSFGDELIVNGGFETGDFTGWTRSGDLGFTGVTNAVDGPGVPRTGTYHLFAGPVGGLGFISQILNTIPGDTYRVSGWLANLSAGTPNRIQISWAGAVIFDQSNFPAFPYSEIAANLVAPGAQTELKIGFQHVPSFFLGDDISVTGRSGGDVIPEPGTMTLFGLGALGLVGYGWRRRHHAN